MLKQHATIFRRLMILADIVLSAGSFYAGYALRQRPENLGPFSDYARTLLIYVAMWWAFLYFGGIYASFRLKMIREIFSVIMKSAFFGLGVFGSVNYLLKVQEMSRTLLVLVFLLNMLVIMAEKSALIYFFRHLRKSGFNFRNILVVGTGSRALHFIRQVDANKEFGLKIFGIIDPDPQKVGELVAGHRVIGTLEAIPEILKTHPLDNVFFIVPRSFLQEIEKPLLYCETFGISVSVAVDLFNLRLTTGKESSLLGLPILTFDSTPDKVGGLLIKRVFDVALAGAALIVLSPVLAAVAVLIKATSRGPVFFKQTRLGMNGRKFTLYKFRTMRPGAEQQLEGLLARNEMKGPVFKMSNDPRLTKIGKVLRRFSLDEWPQLWNVLRGEMSLVGPRPPLEREVAQYDHWQRRRLSMRPGITCLWQISGRNRIVDFEQWMQLDLDYIDNWSLLLDLKILLKTVPVVVLGIGAR